MNTGGSGGEDSEELKEKTGRVPRAASSNENLKGVYNRAETGSNYIGFSDNQEDDEHSCMSAGFTNRLDQAVNLRGSDVPDAREEESSLYLGLQSFMESNA